MKKLLIFALLSLNLLALDLYVGVGASYGNEWNPKAAKIEKKDYESEVYGLNFELTQVLPIVELGLGIGYEKGYKLDSASYDVMPIYALAKVNLFPKGVKPYVVAKYGKTTFEDEKNVTLKDGMFYSAGLGLTLFKKLQAEAACSLSTGKKDGNDLNITKVTLSLRSNIF